MKPLHILLIEDNEGDIVLTREALKEGSVNKTLAVARDGNEAIRYLNKQGQYINERFPDLILLDINLPKVDGKEVLRYIKTHPDFKRTPVIMLTTSSSEKDIADAYNGFANSYIVKPSNLACFMSVARSIEDFWMNVVRLPKAR